MAEDALNALRDQALQCRRCPDLVRSRTTVVFGEGDPRAKILFAGEAPGRDEDIAGRPFIGAAGKLLTQLLKEVVGLSREQVYIANVLKCRPKDNRDPRPEEIENCREYLSAQIALIRPRIICLLGRHSLATVIRPGLKISQVHGTPIRWQGLLFMPIYHPAAALHKGSLLEDLKSDFRNLKKLVEREL